MGTQARLLSAAICCLLAPATAWAQPCLPASSNLTDARATAEGVVFCHDAGVEGVAPQCFSAAVGPTGRYNPEPQPTPETPISLTRTVDDRAVEVCEREDACKTIRVGGVLDHRLPTEQIAAVNWKLGRLAVLTGVQETEALPRVELYDARSGKRLASRPLPFGKKPGKSDYRCGDLAWLGDTLLVRTNVCAGPGGQSWLARGRNLRPIGLLGTRKMNTYRAAPVRVAGNRWAFLATFSRALVVQDIRTGKVLRTISLEGHVEEVDEDSDRVVALADGRLAVVLGADRVGKLLIFGRTAKPEVLTPERCAPKTK